MIKYVLTIAMLVLPTLLLKAQSDEFPRSKKPGKRYLSLGIGISVQNMYDEAISYVGYKGSGLATNLGFSKQSEEKYTQFVILPSFVKLTTKISNDLRPMDVRTTRVPLNYQYLKSVKKWNDGLKLYAGGELSLLFDFKRAEQLDNSQLVYDYALAIGPAGRLEKPIKFNKRSCVATATLSIPLLSHIARPYYLNRIEFIDPQNNFVSDLFKNSQLAMVNKNFRVTTGLYFTYPLFNTNMLRIGYSWDYYKMKTINTVHAAEHLICFYFLSNY